MFKGKFELSLKSVMKKTPQEDGSISTIQEGRKFARLSASLFYNLWIRNFKRLKVFLQYI